MHSLIDEKYMQRCLQIAQNGLGTARPNPSVGAVLVVDDSIIGEGFTSPFGGSHAEVNAIRSVRDTSLLEQATLYVSLEPCSHVGKTPPCADLIVEKRIKRVVIGCQDPNRLVAGKGIEHLKKGGCKVEVGVMEKQCFEHHKRFFSVQIKKRPYIILKWAETDNGFIAPLSKATARPVWISNEESQQLVHKWRSQEHAVLVGTKTVLEDNPSLSVRSWSGNQPIRIVLDLNLRIPSTAQVYDGSLKTIFITGNNIVVPRSNDSLIFEAIDFKKELTRDICAVLSKYEIQSVIIEGGAQTLQSFIDANCWDEARVFTGNVSFKRGVKAPKIQGNLLEEYTIKKDVLKWYTND